MKSVLKQQLLSAVCYLSLCLTRSYADPLFVPHGLEAKVDILSLNFDIIDNINSGRINFIYLY